MVDDEPRAVPCAVVPVHDLLPCRRQVAADVGHTRFDAPAMLDLVAADDLDLYDGNSHRLGNMSPFGASDRPGIHAVGDNRVARAQVVGSHRMGHGVALSLHRHSGSPERFFD